jgi:hypothetical protein
MAEDPATKIEYCSSKMVIRPPIPEAAEVPNVSVKQLSKFPCQRVPETPSWRSKHMMKKTFPAARGGLGAISPCVSLLGREFHGAECCLPALAPDSLGLREPGVGRVA